MKKIPAINVNAMLKRNKEEQKSEENQQQFFFFVCQTINENENISKN